MLQDEDSTQYTWSDSFLLNALNDAQRNIVLFKHSANTVNATLPLQAGTKQNVEDGIFLVGLSRNMGTDGTTPGTPIHRVGWEQFNYIVSAFHTTTAAAEVEVFTQYPEDPSHFYVYPPQPDTLMGSVEEVYTGIPSALSTTSEVISLDNLYEAAILNYMLYRAYAVETDPISSGLSDKYYKLYLNELGVTNG